jgi:hypothetical protein
MFSSELRGDTPRMSICVEVQISNFIRIIELIPKHEPVLLLDRTN